MATSQPPATFDQPFLMEPASPVTVSQLSEVWFGEFTGTSDFEARAFAGADAPSPDFRAGVLRLQFRQKTAGGPVGPLRDAVVQASVGTMAFPPLPPANGDTTLVPGDHYLIIGTPASDGRLQFPKASTTWDQTAWLAVAGKEGESAAYLIVRAAPFNLPGVDPLERPAMALVEALATARPAEALVIGSALARWSPYRGRALRVWGRRPDERLALIAQEGTSFRRAVANLVLAAWDGQRGFVEEASLYLDPGLEALAASARENPDAWDSPAANRFFAEIPALFPRPEGSVERNLRLVRASRDVASIQVKRLLWSHTTRTGYAPSMDRDLLSALDLEMADDRLADTVLTCLSMWLNDPEHRPVWETLGGNRVLTNKGELIAHYRARLGGD